MRPAILADPPGAAPVRDARRLHDRAVVAHIVDDPDKAVIEHRQRLVQDFLQRRHGGAAGRAIRGAGGFDVGLLFGGQGHRFSWIAGLRRACRRDAGGPISGPMLAHASGDAARLLSRLGNPISSPAGQPAMAINGLRNKRCGPGGGTRRLHQFPPDARPSQRDESDQAAPGGRNRLDARGKGIAFARHDTAVIGSKLSCER
jgi:hypothetical protein